MYTSIMAQHTPSSEIYAESSNTGKTPELYLQHATEFLKQSQSMTSLKFNHEQCNYLAKGLEKAVESARNCFNLKVSVCVDNWKFLIRLAMDVQSFIHECCKDEWIQAASMLLNTFEYVASLICRLELCTWRFRSGNEILLGTELREVLSSISEDHDQRLISDAHGQRLINLLKEVSAALDFESISHPGERQLDISLPERLKVALAKNPVLDKPSLAELSFFDEVNLLIKVVQVSLDPESKSSISEQRQLATASLLGKLKTVVANPISDSDLAKFMSYIKVDRKNLEPGEEKLGFSGSGEPVLKVKCPWGYGAQKTFTCEGDPKNDPEVSILALLSHPNILRFLCYAHEGEKCFIVLELMEKNLDGLIIERSSKIDKTREGPFSVNEALDIILQIAEGMYYLYRKRVLHRDLKSSNILVNCKKCVEVGLEFVYAKVADFGLSKRKEMSKTCHHPSWNKGTTRWMAPELILLKGDQPNSSTSDEEMIHEPYKSDVFSFGMVCYEILTGDYPFVNDSPRKAREKVMAGERPPVPSHCPPSLVSMMKKCWRHEPRERPTFAEICAELRIMQGFLLLGRRL